MMQLGSQTTAVIIGLGTAGMATLRDLLRQGVRVKVSDQRPLEAIDEPTLAFLQENQVELETGDHSFSFIEGADLVVLVPVSRWICRCLKLPGQKTFRSMESWPWLQGVFRCR